MEKITEKLLLEKASPKANKLEQIMTLNLSKMRLKLQDLPVKLLSRLQSLEKLDLSGNMLQEFPKNLELPALRFLDLSDNQIEDVTTLDSLSNVEELRMDGNLYITVSDTYKLMVLLPNLRIYNGKDVSTYANHLRYVYSDNLRTRIAALWENSFCLPDPITAEKIDALESKFVSTASYQVKFGPNSVSDFTRWRVSLECFSTCFCKTSQPPITPSRGERRSERPKRSFQEHFSPYLPSPSHDSFLQQPVHLKPLHVLQCHSKQDSLEDFSTQLWASLRIRRKRFERSRLVATCGGDSICLIDCEMGMVMKKYKVPGEEFFSLAWTTVLMSRGGNASAQHCSILAAGGKRGIVKLIHPRNNVAYGEFRASRKALSVLRFNHQQGNFLFTGSYDNKILMWDIGGVDSQYNFKVVQLLVLEIGTTPLHICLPPTAPSAHLLTACEDGLHCYNTQLGKQLQCFCFYLLGRSKEMEITFPIYKKEDKDHDYHTVDGLSFLNDDIVASKNYLYGCIYLWSWSRTKVQRPDKKSKAVRAVVLAELQWTNTQIPYLALNTCPGKFTSSLKNGHGKVEGPSINSVAMDPELCYLVALSDKNMVIVWKREESP
uniref:Leucine-rich repeat and WD repeat-containing protein 1 n=1 Tax=Pundamilia nyererei TaxID=303518 RepID=A0A3B4FT72_9CICH